MLLLIVLQKQLISVISLQFSWPTVLSERGDQNTCMANILNLSDFYSHNILNTWPIQACFRLKIFACSITSTWNVLPQRVIQGPLSLHSRFALMSPQNLTFLNEIAFPVSASPLLSCYATCLFVDSRPPKDVNPSGAGTVCSCNSTPQVQPYM